MFLIILRISASNVLKMLLFVALPEYIRIKFYFHSHKPAQNGRCPSVTTPGDGARPLGIVFSTV